MHNLSRIVAVSLAYILTFWLSSVMLSVANFGEGVGSLNFASLIFLPHGVRVIAAWLYGWRSLIYLAPSAYLVHFWRLTNQHMNFEVLVMPIFGIACVALTFEAVAYFGADLRVKDGYIAPWRAVLLVGSLASTINALGTNLILGNAIQTTLQYLIGDISGMVALFVVLMLLFRYERMAA